MQGSAPGVAMASVAAAAGAAAVGGLSAAAAAATFSFTPAESLLGRSWLIFCVSARGIQGVVSALHMVSTVPSLLGLRLASCPPALHALPRACRWADAGCTGL